MNSIANNLEALHRQITDIAHAYGKARDDIRLMAVSKGQSVEKMRAAYEAGQRLFGENYVQEMVSKQEALKEYTDIQWAYIGQIQSNKIKQIASFCSEVHALESQKHAALLEKHAPQTGIKVFIAIATTDRAQKTGIAPEKAIELAQWIGNNCKKLHVEGIFSVPPQEINDTEEFPELPEALTVLQKTAPLVGRGKMSLGMSRDLRLAIRTGSHCVRIGTALFGSRQ